jgi:hypothetical protein
MPAMKALIALNNYSPEKRNFLRGRLSPREVAYDETNYPPGAVAFLVQSAPAWLNSRPRFPLMMIYPFRTGSLDYGVSPSAASTRRRAFALRKAST